MTLTGHNEKVLIMKMFLCFLILIFSFQSFSKADDIREFEIEGMSVGDSLLDYIDLIEINSLSTSNTSGSKKYTRYAEVKKKNNSENYEGADVWVLSNDSKYEIHSLTGYIEYTENIDECYPKKKEIVSSIEKQLNVKNYSYISNYDENTSKSDVTDFDFSNGKIRIYCTDYSKKKEELGYGDFLGVTVSNTKFLNWLDNEAYK